MNQPVVSDRGRIHTIGIDCKLVPCRTDYLQIEREGKRERWVTSRLMSSSNCPQDYR